MRDCLHKLILYCIIYTIMTCFYDTIQQEVLNWSFRRLVQ